jgi:hypothetical protein
VRIFLCFIIWRLTVSLIVMFSDPSGTMTDIVAQMITGQVHAGTQPYEYTPHPSLGYNPLHNSVEVGINDPYTGNHWSIGIPAGGLDNNDTAAGNASHAEPSAAGPSSLPVLPTDLPPAPNSLPALPNVTISMDPSN